MPAFPSRRGFLQVTAGAMAYAGLRAQRPSAAHLNVADLDRTTILQQAKAALAAPVAAPPASIFHTEIEPTLATAGASPQPRLLRADAVALQTFSATVAALTAGFLLTHEDVYSAAAVKHIQPWLLAPKTRLEPVFDQAGCAEGTAVGTPAGMADLVPLAELARSFSFLTEAFAPEDLKAIQNWFTATSTWLNSNRAAMIAREAKDHRASAHLLLSATFTRFLQDESGLEATRKRFQAHTLRNQVRADGVFPQEVATPNPYRNTLYNFDLLAGACQLLSSQFDLLWSHELIDGVGLRIVAAYLYPVIAHPETWGYPADAQHFRDLPGRRPGLLFAGRAYNRPEYVEAWQQYAADPTPALAESYPIRQPSLWTARAPHGL